MTNNNKKPRKQELSPGYNTKPFVHVPSHTTTINPAGGISGIKQPSFPIKKSKGKEGQEIIEISREAW